MELFTRDEPTLKLGKASKDENAEEEISNASKGCSSRSLFSSFKPECRNVVRVVADMLMGIHYFKYLINELNTQPKP